QIRPPRPLAMHDDRSRKGVREMAFCTSPVTSDRSSRRRQGQPLGAGPWGGLAVVGFLGGCLGFCCVTTAPPACRVSASPHPPSADVQRIVATWDKEIYTAEDTQHKGSFYHVLRGNLYLFGPTISNPLKGNGNVIVDLYDDQALTSGGQPVHLEEWWY